MTVESAMGQAGARHQPGDADRLDAVAPEPLRRHFDDMLSCGVLMAFRVTHGIRRSPVRRQALLHYDKHIL